MAKIKIVHDTAMHTLTVWLDDPSSEHTCEETTDEVVLMKNREGRVIGFELLHYHPSSADARLDVETRVRA
ncbi:MAG: DUF2283 domain-containing protein, partial [Candidatus Binatia bacterium]